MMSSVQKSLISILIVLAFLIQLPVNVSGFRTYTADSDWGYNPEEDGDYDDWESHTHRVHTEFDDYWNTNGGQHYHEHGRDGNEETLYDIVWRGPNIYYIFSHGIPQSTQFGGIYASSLTDGDLPNSTDGDLALPGTVAHIVGCHSGMPRPDIGPWGPGTITYEFIEAGAWWVEGYSNKLQIHIGRDLGKMWSDALTDEQDTLLMAHMEIVEEGEGRLKHAVPMYYTQPGQALKAENTKLRLTKHLESGQGVKTEGAIWDHYMSPHSNSNYQPTQTYLYLKAKEWPYFQGEMETEWLNEFTFYTSGGTPPNENLFVRTSSKGSAPDSPTHAMKIQSTYSNGGYAWAKSNSGPNLDTSRKYSLSTWFYKESNTDNSWVHVLYNRHVNVIFYDDTLGLKVYDKNQQWTDILVPDEDIWYKIVAVVDPVLETYTVYTYNSNTEVWTKDENLVFRYDDAFDYIKLGEWEDGNMKYGNGVYWDDVQITMLEADISIELDNLGDSAPKREQTITIEPAYMPPVELGYDIAIPYGYESIILNEDYGTKGVIKTRMEVDYGHFRLQNSDLVEYYEVV